MEGPGARARLLAPEVGLYQAAFRRGALVSAGSTVGVLLQLGVPRALVVPAGVEGRVASDPPAHAHEPVGWGDALLEVELEVERGAARGAAPGTGAPTTAAAETTAAAHGGAPGGAVCVRAPSSGRFWHRPAPGEPPYVREGERIEDGAPVGLLEVMKTFSPVVHRSGPGLAARVVRVLAADGADVRAGQPLVELESAP